MFPNSRILICILSTLLACKDEDRLEIVRMDNYLSETWTIDNMYLEEELNAHKNSAFFNGMYIYFNSDSSNVQGFKRKINELKKNGLLGAYIKLAESHLFGILGDTTNAEVLLSEALRIDSTNHWLLLELSHLKSSNSERIYILTRAISIKPNFYRAKLFKALLLDVTTDAKQIIELIESSDNLPMDIDIYNYLAEAYFFSGDIDRSESLYLKSIEIKKNVNAFVGLGSTYHYQKQDLNLAETYLQSAYKIDSTNISVIRSIGWLFYDLYGKERSDYYFSKLIDRLSELDETDISDLLDYYILNKDAIRSKLIVRTMIENFGENYRTIGYDLIVNYIKPNNEGNDLYLNLYKKNFGQSSFEWLDDKLNQLEFDISSKIIVEKPNI